MVSKRSTSKADTAMTTPSPRTARPHQVSAVWFLAIRPALTASPIAPGVNACAPVHSALQTQSARRARQKLAAIHSRYRHGPRISGVPATASGKVRTGSGPGKRGLVYQQPRLDFRGGIRKLAVRLWAFRRLAHLPNCTTKKGQIQRNNATQIDRINSE